MKRKTKREDVARAQEMRTHCCPSHPDDAEAWQAEQEETNHCGGPLRASIALITATMSASQAKSKRFAIERVADVQQRGGNAILTRRLGDQAVVFQHVGDRGLRCKIPVDEFRRLHA